MPFLWWGSAFEWNGKWRLAAVWLPPGTVLIQSLDLLQQKGVFSPSLPVQPNLVGSTVE